MTAERMGWRTYLTVGVVLAAVLTAMLLVRPHHRHHHHRSAAPGPGEPTSSVAPTPTDLTLGVYGSPAELATYRGLASAYQKAHAGVQVEVRAYASRADLLQAVHSGAVPDVYLLDRSDLSGVIDAGLNQPLGTMLPDRGVSLGDNYSRDAVAAFSADDDLQCMPFTVSPMVIYYNTDLIHLQRMRTRGLSVPSSSGLTFTMNDLRAAARVATRARGHHAAGIAIAPTLQGLAPFIYSGGGQLFDDDTHPTRLALGDDSSTNALRSTLEVLRDPQLSLTAEQLGKDTAVDRFKAGRLGMIAGFRGLVPQLRATKGLHFDVLAMPVIGDHTTVGEFRGLCLAHGKHTQVEAAADLLTSLISDASMRRVAQTGSLEPADLRVAYSKAFLQPTQQPANSLVFTRLLRYIVTPPLDVPWGRLQTAVAGQLDQLMSTPVLDDLDVRLDNIDKRSMRILSPPTPTPSPSASPTS
ncbi:ABC transporter substrate-binding protein [Nocardioides montaniterrae]